MLHLIANKTTAWRSTHWIKLVDVWLPSSPWFTKSDSMCPRLFFSLIKKTKHFAPLPSLVPFARPRPDVFLSVDINEEGDETRRYDPRRAHTHTHENETNRTVKIYGNFIRFSIHAPSRAARATVCVCVFAHVGSIHTPSAFCQRNYSYNLWLWLLQLQRFSVFFISKKKNFFFFFKLSFDRRGRRRW